MSVAWLCCTLWCWASSLLAETSRSKVRASALRARAQRCQAGSGVVAATAAAHLWSGKRGWNCAIDRPHYRAAQPTLEPKTLLIFTSLYSLYSLVVLTSLYSLRIFLLLYSLLFFYATLFINGFLLLYSLRDFTLFYSLLVFILLYSLLILHCFIHYWLNCCFMTVVRIAF